MKPTLIKIILKNLYWFFSSQIGLDPLKLFSSLRGVPIFLKDWWNFRKKNTDYLVWKPCLYDRYEEGGITKNEYFWQDLLVARWIYAAAPEKHVDVGSRVDGFITHVASFREIEVFDVRPITSKIPGIIFRQADMMKELFLPENTKEEGYCDSLSCLHTIEHFGLGRYGDSIDTQGYIKGLENLSKLLLPNGFLYLSTPIGKERVEFNANRVFDPRTIMSVASKVKLELIKLTIFNIKEGIQELTSDEATLSYLAKQHYNLGIFTFKKQEK